MTPQAKGTIHKEAISTKGMAITIKIGETTQTEVGGIITNKEEGRMEETKDGTTTTHKTASHKTNHSLNKIKEGTINHINHHIKDNLHPNPINLKFLKSPTHPTKTIHFDPYSKGKKSSKPQLLPVSPDSHRRSKLL